jgi:hypothetical protein
LSDNLLEGEHKAVIYLSSTYYRDNRWSSNVPNSLRITSIDVASGANLLPSISAEKKVLFYGDSITEGLGLPTGGALTE